MKTLIVFAKAPVPGQVKTRLSESTPLNDNQICGLYETFLKDVFTIAAMSLAETIAVHFTPADQEKSMRRILKVLNLGIRNENRFVFAPQEGESFTERVTNSFKTAERNGGQESIMIGSDSPLISPDAIDEAFEFIYSRSGMALGPSGEGGLYLIGFPSSAPVSFDGVFTQGAELENLLNAARSMNMPLKILPETLDVDVEADLIELVALVRALDYERKFNSLLFPLNTAKAIEGLKLRIARSGGDSRGKKIEIGGD